MNHKVRAEGNGCGFVFNLKLTHFVDQEGGRREDNEVEERYVCVAGDAPGLCSLVDLRGG